MIEFKCPHCSRPMKVSDTAVGKKGTCKSCGNTVLVPGQSPNSPAANINEDEVLYKGSPSMFRSSPISFIITLILCVFLLGIPILIGWWLRCKNEVLTVTRKRSEYRKGLLSKSTTEVYHSDVRNVQISQSFFQRMLGTGKIGISSAGQSGMEIEITGISHPQKVKSIIDQFR